MSLKVLRVMYHQRINLTEELFDQKLVIRLYSRAAIPKCALGS